jgi:hypothetical protein
MTYPLLLVIGKRGFCHENREDEIIIISMVNSLNIKIKKNYSWKITVAGIFTYLYLAALAINDVQVNVP